LKPDLEQVLVCRLAAGDAAAYGQLYDRYAAAMLRTGTTMLGSVHDAQDAVQEVFLAVARGRRRLAAVRNLRAYLFTALRRQCARQSVRRRRHATAAAATVQAEPTTQQQGDGPDDRLTRALSALPDEQREVLTLKIDGGMTFAELAAVLGISPNTAASRYRYALAKLRASLET